MKRDMNTVREILLKISDAPAKADQSILVDERSPEEEKKILYHVALLNDAGLITGEALSGLDMETPIWTDLDLTWEGHDFLDAVRDPTLWQKTKEGVEQAEGFTFELLKALAKGFVKKQIEERTGVKLDI
jgi:hypothetical protein